MPSQTEKKRLKKLNADRAAKGEPPIVRSKPRPRSELNAAIAISRPGAPKKVPIRVKREMHPVDKLFFATPPKITHDEFRTATTFRLLYESLERTGVDSTQALLTMGGGGSNQAGWTVAQKANHTALQSICAALPDWEYEIVRKVCGEAWPLKDAVMQHSICHKDGVLDMFKNTLLHLKKAIDGADVAWRVVQEVSQYRVNVARSAA